MAYVTEKVIPFHASVQCHVLSADRIRTSVRNETGVVRGFTAKPSLYALGASSILIHGRSEAG